MPTTPTPVHLRPGSCFVCGSSEPHSPGSHAFWSNQDAQAYFAAEQARLAPARSPEARYVAEYRPY